MYVCVYVCMYVGMYVHLLSHNSTPDAVCPFRRCCASAALSILSSSFVFFAARTNQSQCAVVQQLDGTQNAAAEE
jgi:hypothetical protein